MAELHTAVANRQVVVDPAGALWLSASRTLVVADLHLEKGSAFARRGMFLPPYDTAATLLMLSALLLRRNPRRVICLGDSFHDSGGHGRLRKPRRLSSSVLYDFHANRPPVNQSGGVAFAVQGKSARSSDA